MNFVNNQPFWSEFCCEAKPQNRQKGLFIECIVLEFVQQKQDRKEYGMTSRYVICSEIKNDSNNESVLKFLGCDSFSNMYAWLPFGESTVRFSSVEEAKTWWSNFSTITLSLANMIDSRSGIRIEKQISPDFFMLVDIISN